MNAERDAALSEAARRRADGRAAPARERLLVLATDVRTTQRSRTGPPGRTTCSGRRPSKVLVAAGTAPGGYGRAIERSADRLGAR